MGTFARIALALVATLLVPTLCTDVSAQDRSPRTVLVVHWGPEEFPATPAVNTALGEALTSDSELPIDFFTEYLESDRFPPDEATAALADYIRRKYRGRRIDLVIAIADPALRFVLDYREELFPGAPIVYSGVAIPDGVSRSDGGGLTAVMRGIAYAETLRLALELHRATEQVFVVARSRDAKTIESARAELDQFSRRVRLTYLNDPTVPRMLAALGAVPQRSLVLYIWYVQDDPGHIMYADEIVHQVVRASPVPVYGTNDDYIGSGVVGGVVRGTRETAARLGEMARQILKGTRAQDIPIENARLVPIVDWRAVRRWGIDPSRLPPGSNVRFRTPTAWESYRWYIIGTVIVVAAQLLLIAGLLTQVARRQRAEETIRRREATLRESYERIRNLAGRLINAQEAARAQIARDLHDDVCQQLVGVSMDVSRLGHYPGGMQDARAQHALSMVKQRALGVVDTVRQLSHNLHPATLRLVGLPAALQAHCIEVEKRHDVQVGFKSEGDLTFIDADVALCLFRIGQEALRNGAVHGGARRLALSITRSGATIELTVSDDGRGFDLEAAREVGRGLGLVSMEERAHMVGGEMSIVTHVREGTTVRVRVPARADRGAEQNGLTVQARAFAQHSHDDPEEQV